MQSKTEFSSLPLLPALQKNLQQAHLEIATPIQAACIPAAIEGKDIIGIAQTGTGKTFAFGLPMIQRLMSGEKQGLIVVPTRELALQVEESLRRITTSLSIRFAVLIGGASMGAQKNSLRSNPQIIIATPGRLIDHLKQKTMTLQSVTMLVLDEADRMFDMGFAPQVEQILHHLPEERQTMLFSATMPDGIAQMVKRHMRLPVRIEIAPQGTLAAKLEQEVFVVRGGMKSQLLEKLLTDYNGTVLVFIRTKHAAKRISALIRNMGHTSAELHSNRTLGQRKQALQGFKSGRYRVLVATDIAARGIDVSNIELVINYDLPENPEDYVHRIGRTGRAGQAGKAISFATPDQVYDLKKIERLTRSKLPQSQLPKELPASRVAPRDGGTESSFKNNEYQDHGRHDHDRGARSFERSERPRFRNDESRGERRSRPQRSFTREQQVWVKPGSNSSIDEKILPTSREGQGEERRAPRKPFNRPFRERRSSDSYGSSGFGRRSFGEKRPFKSGPRREGGFSSIRDENSRSSYTGTGDRPYFPSEQRSERSDRTGFGNRSRSGFKSNRSGFGGQRSDDRGGQRSRRPFRQGASRRGPRREA